MPIYEYRCNACGHQHEALQKLGAEPLLRCPACNQDELKKLISAAGFRLKGTGWYETDFKGGGQKNVVESKDTKKPSSEGGSGSGSGCAGSCACH
jgi:putative FmdB family regulatory protein